MLGVDAEGMTAKRKLTPDFFTEKHAAGGHLVCGAKPLTPGCFAFNVKRVNYPY